MHSRLNLLCTLIPCSLLLYLCGTASAFDRSDASETSARGRATVALQVPGASPADANHPPETYIDLDTLEILKVNVISPQVIRNRKYYSLPSPTSTYPGILIGWEGSDSLDYPVLQPPFEFNWVLFGPYADQAAALPDSARIWATNDDPQTAQLEWTEELGHSFYGLSSGWYVFWVRSRDDSAVVDPTPAIARFEVVTPEFDKPFLLMDATNWLNGNLSNSGSYFFREPRPDSLTPDTVRALYEDLFTGHGYAFDRTVDTWYRQTENLDEYRVLPDRDVLACYKALIVYDEDMILTLDMDNWADEFTLMLGEYLSVGGRVVFIGRNLFVRSFSSAWDPRLPPLEYELPATDMGNLYFGITRMYFPQNLYSVNALRTDVSDFKGVLALDPGFPVVDVDTARTLKLANLPFLVDMLSPASAASDRDGDGLIDWLYTPDVNWIEIDLARGASAFYQFNSAHPDTSPSQGRTCGARLEFFDPLLGQPTFRTTIITFPLSPMIQDQNLRTLAGALLDGILSDDAWTGVGPGEDQMVPRQSGQLQNYPNPFNAGTRIRYTLHSAQRSTVTIYNALGQHVRTLADGVRPVGTHEIIWDGRDGRGREVGSGVYICRLQLGEEGETRKMLLLR